jgi:hypothetical protein
MSRATEEFREKFSDQVNTTLAETTKIIEKAEQVSVSNFPEQFCQSVQEVLRTASENTADQMASELDSMDSSKSYVVEISDFIPVPVPNIVPFQRIHANLDSVTDDLGLLSTPNSNTLRVLENANDKLAKHTKFCKDLEDSCRSIARTFASTISLSETISNSLFKDTVVKPEFCVNGNTLNAVKALMVVNHLSTSYLNEKKSEFLAFLASRGINDTDYIEFYKKLSPNQARTQLVKYFNILTDTTSKKICKAIVQVSNDTGRYQKWLESGENFVEYNVFKELAPVLGSNLEDLYSSSNLFFGVANNPVSEYAELERLLATGQVTRAGHIEAAKYAAQKAFGLNCPCSSSRSWSSLDRELRKKHSAQQPPGEGAKRKNVESSEEDNDSDSYDSDASGASSTRSVSKRRRNNSVDPISVLLKKHAARREAGAKGRSVSTAVAAAAGRVVKVQ